jgi:four helix bundle protein
MARFVQIAMGSGAELSYHLLLARDLCLLNKEMYESMDSDLAIIMRMMSALSSKVRTPIKQKSNSATITVLGLPAKS